MKTQNEVLAEELSNFLDRALQMSDAIGYSLVSARLSEAIDSLEGILGELAEAPCWRNQFDQDLSSATVSDQLRNFLNASRRSAER